MKQNGKRGFGIAKCAGALLVLVFLLLTGMARPAQAAVRLSPKSVTLIKGQTQVLKVTGAKEKVTWSTNNPDVAGVSSSGKVTAKKKGSATITAAADGEKLTCRVTVEEPYISHTSRTIKVGGTAVLKVYGTSQKVTWASSAKTVATVTQADKVTGKKKGNSTITATVLGKKFTCKVTVEAEGKSGKSGSSGSSGKSGSSGSSGKSGSLGSSGKSGKSGSTAKKVTLDRKTVTLTTGETAELKATRTGTTAKLVWSSSDKSVATVTQSGKITAKGAGKAVITVKAGTVEATCRVTVKEPEIADMIGQLLELLGEGSSGKPGIGTLGNLGNLGNLGSLFGL